MKSDWVRRLWRAFGTAEEEHKGDVAVLLEHVEEELVLRACAMLNTRKGGSVCERVHVRWRALAIIRRSRPSTAHTIRKKGVSGCVQSARLGIEVEAG